MFTVGTSEDTLYSKSISMQIWLLGYEMTETIGGGWEAVWCGESVIKVRRVCCMIIKLKC